MITQYYKFECDTCHRSIFENMNAEGMDMQPFRYAIREWSWRMENDGQNLKCSQCVLKDALREEKD